MTYIPAEDLQQQPCSLNENSLVSLLSYEFVTSNSVEHHRPNMTPNAFRPCEGNSSMSLISRPAKTVSDFVYDTNQLQSLDAILGEAIQLSNRILAMESMNASPIVIAGNDSTKHNFDKEEPTN